jgi:hypothetical protein
VTMTSSLGCSMTPKGSTRRMRQPDPRLAAIVERLSVTIPDRPKPRPKPQQSWATLKVGDTLDHTSTRYRVTSCDSQGVTLDPPLRLQQRDWAQQGWHKVPKRELKGREGAKADREDHP